MGRGGDFGAASSIPERPQNQRSTATQAVPAAIETALNKVIGTREVALDAPDPALKVMTRRLKDADVYLFFNEGAQAISHSVTLGGQVVGLSGILTGPGSRDLNTPFVVETWPPATGNITPIASTTAKGGVLKLELKPCETALLTVR